MARKQRVDSAASAAKMLAAVAKGDPEVPSYVKLRDGDMPFWRAIVKARTRDDWLDSDLVVVAQLARAQADAEDEQRKLDEEGTVVINRFGDLAPNPRVRVLETLTRRSAMLMRALRLAGATIGDVREQAATIRAKRAAERALADVNGEADDVGSAMQDDDLLARHAP